MKLYDEDGIDGPFEQGMRRATRDDDRLRALGLRRLPTAGRSSAGMETRCDACGEEIEDALFCARMTEAGVEKLHERCALRGAKAVATGRVQP